MGCGLSRNAQVMPSPPSPEWDRGRHRASPCVSGEFPTLLPHQVAYNLAVSNPPPPPYSREPLTGHWSVVDADQLFASRGRGQLQLQGQDPAAGEGGHWSPTADVLDGLRDRAQLTSSFGLYHRSSPQVYPPEGRDDEGALEQVADFYQPTPLPSMTELGHLSPPSPVLETDPRASPLPRPPSAQSMPLASMPVILGSQDLFHGLGGEETPRPGSRPGSRTSHRGLQQLAVPCRRSSIEGPDPGGSPRGGVEAEMPALLPLQPDLGLPMASLQNLSPPPQPPPLRSIVRTPVFSSPLWDSPPVIPGGREGLVVSAPHTYPPPRVQRSITFPRMVPPKGPIRLPPIHNSQPHPLGAGLNNRVSPCAGGEGEALYNDSSQDTPPPTASNDAGSTPPAANSDEERSPAVSRIDSSSEEGCSDPLAPPSIESQADISFPFPSKLPSTPGRSLQAQLSSPEILAVPLT